MVHSATQRFPISQISKFYGIEASEARAGRKNKCRVCNSSTQNLVLTDCPRPRELADPLTKSWFEDI